MAVDNSFINITYCKNPSKTKLSNCAYLQSLLHSQWPSWLSPGPPSGGPRSQRCPPRTGLPPAARSRRSGASGGPSRQTWATGNQRRTSKIGLFIFVNLSLQVNGCSWLRYSNIAVMIDLFPIMNGLVSLLCIFVFSSYIYIFFTTLEEISS